MYLVPVHNDQTTVVISSLLILGQIDTLEAKLRENEINESAEIFSSQLRVKRIVSLDV